MRQNRRFAWITDESIPRSHAEWDREIGRTDSFVAIPSIGALVPGWTLVIPRRTLRNLAETTPDERTELLAFVETIAQGLAGDSRNEVYCFEHGSGRPGSLTGCGVDQAHLHVVPLAFNLIDAAIRRSDGPVQCSIPRTSQSPLELLPRNGEYVAIWRLTDRLTTIGTVRYPVSQWVRRVIAEELGKAAEWNYRTHPQVKNVGQTLRMLAGLRTSLSQ